ncbi:AAA family ATPase [Shewanella sp. 1_MG-2023]|uniref:S16 family serine protease n=1 Tax=unclassified Shewanella TaxID=196818 RepID=UPI0026E1273A|nr:MULTISPECIES: S16 family serine protease [unclassified Shewanella]MDO6612264.1 AAA family ATPase [Shewanella sp. 7_MG-2023]MDO6772118.1 AAA family ATPase [Shewanella sp. 2_MG-2023]MDO6796083.1 AAA family ATPase [Shewanella sp. 1_MG-2023]
MTTTLIPTSQLAPQYTLPQSLPSTIYLSQLLLGQERCVDAFNLMSKVEQQHLYLADYASIDRALFIKALVGQADTPADSYLVATKSKNENHDFNFRWQTELPSANVGTIASQNQLFSYVSGQIRRADLIGKMQKTDKASQYKAGILASNHFVFIDVESLWKREGLWEFVMQVLEQGFYRINSELAPIPLNCKIILVGSANLFTHLRTEDRVFFKYFPLLAEVNSELDLTKYSESQYLQWLMSLANEYGIQLELSSLMPLFWYSAKLTEHQQRLSLSMLQITQVLLQAKAYTNNKAVTASAIAKVILHAKKRHDSSALYAAQNFADNFINLQTSGEMIGQINGLTVVDTHDASYGEPARITTTVHYGDGEVIDIERKSELGGNIHTKGMMILSASLYRIFGRDVPLHLNANIVFEQSYQEIDGDSASLAEYCCLMSAIAEQPINQAFAITGALDQFGNVQAIGGVNEKIEGFFNLCQTRGLNGEHSVIIPKSNVLQLNLEPEIIDAISKGLFHVHAIEHMDEAISLLMQIPAGERNQDNDFPEKSLYGLVQQRLEKMAGQDDDDIEPSFLQKILIKLRII